MNAPGAFAQGSLVYPSFELPAPWTNAAATSGPATRVLSTAQQMYDEGVVVRGSCYRYVDTVFDRAGFHGWRNRSNVFRSAPNGPYASLDMIQPGDWLWIVNHPESTPVGTHSVLFVGWEDRANGIARVYSYVGGGQERSADLVTYDVTRTYNIQRAIQDDRPQARAAPRRVNRNRRVVAPRRRVRRS
jgi:hypothetical protein